MSQSPFGQQSSLMNNKSWAADIDPSLHASAGTPLSNNSGTIHGSSSSPLTPHNGSSQGQQMSGENVYSMGPMFDILQKIDPRNQALINSAQQQQHHHQQHQQQQHHHHHQSPLVANQELSNDLQHHNGWAQPAHAAPHLNHIHHQQAQNHLHHAPLNSGIPQMLAPNQINWVYLDPAGNLQGPFDGMMMQSWYSAGYLTLDLKLKRAEEAQYQSLGDLIKTLGDLQAPFYMPLPDLSSHVYQPQSSSTTHPALSINPSIPARVQSPWDQQNSPAQDFLGSGRQSPFVSSAKTLLDTSGSGSGSATLKQSGATFTEPQQGQESQAEQQQELAQEQEVRAASVATEIAPQQDQQGQQGEAKTASEVPSVEQVTPEPVLRVKPTVEQLQTVPEDPKPISPEVKMQPAPKPKVAAWASSTSVNSSKPKMSLLEIQELEANQKAEQEAQQAAAAAAALAATQESSLLQNNTPFQSDSKPALPRAASWASRAQPSSAHAVPTKTLADIQREEQEAADAAEKEIRRKNTLAAKMAESATAFTNSTAEGSWTVISKKPLVKPVIKQSVPGVSVNVGKSLTPSMLRSVSATSAQLSSSPASTSATATGVAASPMREAPKPPAPTIAASPAVRQANNVRDEFFIWCRQQLSQLNKGVNKEDVLSILIQLPTSLESQEIIADTIYSNSSIMDGRKFAGEFCKKKQTIEKSIPHGIAFSWTEEMMRTLNSEGQSSASSSKSSGGEWDDAFKVVTKKKNRRNNKEF